MLIKEASETENETWILTVVADKVVTVARVKEEDEDKSTEETMKELIEKFFEDHCYIRKFGDGWNKADIKISVYGELQKEVLWWSS